MARTLLALAATGVWGLVSAGPAIASPGQLEPEPPAPTPTVLTPPPAGVGNVLAQNGTQPGGPLGIPDLSAYASNMLLGQTAGPTTPGAPAAPGPAVIPNLSAFSPEYLLGQNVTPAAPGSGAAAPGLAPDQDSPGTGRIAFLRRLYEMYQTGALSGALLGQQSPEQFAE